MTRDPRRSSTERKRRYRERQRLGIAVVAIEADLLGLADALVVDGFLHRRDEGNFDAIRDAATRMVAAYILGERNASLTDPEHRR